MGKWTEGQSDGCKCGQTGRWLEGQVIRQMDGWVGEQLIWIMEGRWKDAQMDRWMDEEGREGGKKKGKGEEPEDRWAEGQNGGLSVVWWEVW